ncbi:MAG: hypothetical protein AAF495_10965 [Pseudomonadota bacterium]
MRALLPLLTLGLLLAACTPEAPRRPLQVVASAALSGPEAEMVRVHVSQIPPGAVIESVALVGPDGARIEADDWRRASSESGPRLEGDSVLGIGVVASGSSSGLARASVGSGGIRSGNALSTQQITAQIPVPDPATYLEQARDWRVEVRYRDVAGSARVLTLPAPRR